MEMTPIIKIKKCDTVHPTWWNKRGLIIHDYDDGTFRVAVSFRPDFTTLILRKYEFTILSPNCPKGE